MRLIKWIFKWLNFAQLQSSDRVTLFADFEPPIFDQAILDNHAMQQGYAPLADQAGGGGGMTVQQGRNISEGAGFGSGGAAQSDQTGHGAGYGYRGWGYALYDGDHLRIYPIYGIGGYGGGVDDDTHEPIRTSGILGLIGLSVECVPLRVFGIGLMVGVRAGIRFNPAILKEQNFPSTALRLFWIQLVLGIDRKKQSNSDE